VKGLGDLSNIVRHAKQLQQQFERAQAEIAQMKAEATAGGGMVKATVNGRGELIDLAIEREVVDPGDVEMLVDLIIAAVQEAQKRAQALAQEKLGPMADGLRGLGLAG